MKVLDFFKESILVLCFGIQILFLKAVLGLLNLFNIFKVNTYKRT